jgi:hypothetical protein
MISGSNFESRMEQPGRCGPKKSDEAEATLKSLALWCDTHGQRPAYSEHTEVLILV